MNSYLAFYKDPLFSIAILLGAIALIIFADYYRNLYRRKKKQNSLKALVKSYENQGFYDGIVDFLKVSKNPIPTLIFLAKSYVGRGDHQQAIRIYSTLLEGIEGFEEKLEILEELGGAYFQAGFLQNAKEIYFEILRYTPRNTRVLIELIKVQETLGDYTGAIEALGCLEELHEHLTQEAKERLLLAYHYLEVKMILSDGLASQEKKNQRLCEILGAYPALTRLILGYFKFYAPKLFWEFLPQEQIEQYIDLLWDIPLSQFPHLPSTALKEVLGARGDQACEACSNFALETLRLFHFHSKQKATLSFSYACKSCQGEFPFDEFRCPNCGELGMMKLNLKPQKVRDEKSASLL